ncbi:senescence-associated protein, partial [Trifolium pratense]
MTKPSYCYNYKQGRDKAHGRRKNQSAPKCTRNLLPDWGCIPKQPDLPTATRGATGSEHNDSLTLSGAPFKGTCARSAAEDASPDYNSNAEGDRF